MRALLVVVFACGHPPDAAQPVVVDAPPVSTSPVLLVANKADATLSVLELPGGKSLATLPTGLGPHEIAVSPDGKRAVISNYGDPATLGKTLTVVDLPTLAVVQTIDLADLRRPHGIAFLDDRRVIVTCEVNAVVAIVDLQTQRIEHRISTSQQGSHTVAVSGDKQRAYVANVHSGSVTAIDLVAKTASEPIVVAPATEGIAIAGDEVWTGSNQADKVFIYDAPAMKPDGELPGGGVPIRITATPDGKAMLVSSVNGSAMQLIDVATRQATTIALPAKEGPTSAPVGTVIAPDGKTAYVALVAENRVAVIDLASKTVTAHLPVGNQPDGINYSTAFVR